MHDGAIVFKTKIDNSDVQKDLDRVERDIEKSQKSIAENEAAKLPLLKDAEQLKTKLQEARKELAFFKEEQAAAQAVIGGESLEDHLEAYDRLPALNAAVEDQQKKVDQLEKEWSQVNSKVDKYDHKINQAKASLEEQKAAAGRLSKELTKGGINMSGAMEKAQKSADKFKKRLASIVSQVFVFTLVSKALQGITKYMGKALKSNKEFTSELAKLKGALLTAFQPIYELLVPALMALMRIATSVVTAVARVAALLGGKSMSQYSKNAKALYEEANAIEKTGDAAKKAQRSLAGFDEINQLSGNSTINESESTGTSAPDFSAFDTDVVKQKVDELVLFLSGALLLIGMILTLTGANIPLGLGLMAVGAVGLASEITANWDTVKEIISKHTDLILAISSILFIVGMILAFSGAAIPLGIGLMLAGAAGIGTTAAVNWNGVVTALQGPLGKIMALVSGALLVIGIILVCTGVGIPLGIALIAAGAAGLVTVTAVNWNAIKDKVVSVWDGIKKWWGSKVAPVFTKKYWQDKFANMVAALPDSWKTAINKVIAVVNNFIKWVNDKLHLKWDALTIAGIQITPAVDYQLFSIPSIPYLAQGAVIPPNAPFLAMLGDQRHGTNIEAPVSTIQDALAEVLSAYGGSGDEAVIEKLDQILSAILSIEVGDTTIGKAANRYNEKMAIIKGRA